MATTTALDTSASRRPDLDRSLIAFGAAAVVTIFVAIAFVLAVGQAYSGRILPGVRVGTVDVGGLAPEAASARLAAAYGRLAEGTIAIRTPSGRASVSYAAVGRGPDVAAMTAAALEAGREGDPISQSIDTLRTVLGGSSLPVLVRLDPGRLATELRTVTKAGDVPAKDASVVATKTGFAVTPGAAGRGADEKALSGAILTRLSAPNAPSAISVATGDVTLEPAVSDAQAERALGEALGMDVAVPITLGSRTWTLSEPVVRRAIEFGIRPDGSYGPLIDSSAITAQIEAIAATVDTPATEPTIMSGKPGTPLGATAGRSGRAVDVAATSKAVVAYLDALQAGRMSATPQLVETIVEPKLTQAQVLALAATMKKLGSWTVQFQPLVSNGWGANIRLPAGYINGTVVAPGDEFSFWQATGPITLDRGFRMGGVIINGKSDFTGAIGGGICSASTTLFNAALRAGLQIDERHNHAYYIDRYPAGLDATVFQDGSQVSDMKFTNDTANAILIRGSSTTRSVTFEIWGIPDGRVVHISQGPKTSIVFAHNTTQPVTTIPVGTSTWTEFATNGFNIWAYRTVTDASGKVIHNDSWYSHYIKVDGVQEIGVASLPGSTPTPAGTPPPTGTPAPHRTPTPRPSPSATPVASPKPSPSR